MSNQSKKEYLVTVRARYRNCQSRKEKSVIISEIETNLGIVRKSAIRLLKQRIFVRRKTIRSRKEVYGYDLIKPLRQIWEVVGQPCSKRLKPDIGDMIKKLKEFGEIELCGDQEKLLKQMSTFTIDRLLEAERDISKKEYGLSGTKRSPLLKTLIPVRTNFNTEETKEPGHTEMDCVLHCGESLSGHYAETLNVLDIYSHWNEKKIFLNKTKAKVVGAFHEMKTKQFPFSILSVDFDNGHEFVNWVLKGYCDRNNISYTRSRSYHKNDQAHIEGKNYQSIRRVVGYDRITDPKLVEMINDMYQNEHRLLTNYFYTTLKLKEKEKINGKTTKSYEVAKTPYKRLIESDKISEEIKIKLKTEYMRLNPAELQRNLRKKLKRIKDHRLVTVLNLATTSINAAVRSHN
ncbi:hypothetical protein HY061_00520 [Candidatus Azambacteria bacterium]|nr:hypothetical protein [Candidatus Azambacteria bacterium]